MPADRPASTAPDPRHAVTALLAQVSSGHHEAFDALMPLVYDELRELAEHKLRYERDDHTLTPTALVHEAYLRLVDQHSVQWQSRAHFFAIAAQAMRRILVTHAEKRRAGKRGGGTRLLPLDADTIADGTLLTERGDETLLALDRALTRLATFNERGCRVVEYRFFGGLQYDEVAELLGVSPVTVRRSWVAARAWLRRELEAS